MLWYKAWLDTRWRFLIGLAVVLVAACGIVFTYPQLQALLSDLATSVGSDDAPTRGSLAEAVEMQQSYGGFIHSQWFHGNFMYLATFLAALLGCGNPFSGAGRGLMLSLALPVTRERWVATRALTGLAQVGAISLAGALAVAALSPLIGEHYGVGDTLVHAACSFVVTSVIFGLSMLLTTAFDDAWPPLLLGCLAAIVVGFVELLLPGNGPFAVMSARSWFVDRSLPWIGLGVSAALAAALMFAAAANVARRDY